MCSRQVYTHIFEGLPRHVDLALAFLEVVRRQEPNGFACSKRARAEAPNLYTLTSRCVSDVYGIGVHRNNTQARYSVATLRSSPSVVQYPVLTSLTAPVQS